MYTTNGKITVHLTEKDTETIKKLYDGVTELCNKYKYCDNCPMFELPRKLNVPCSVMKYYLVINGISATDDFEIIMENEK